MREIGIERRRYIRFLFLVREKRNEDVFYDKIAGEDLKKEIRDVLAEKYEKSIVSQYIVFAHREIFRIGDDYGYSYNNLDYYKYQLDTDIIFNIIDEKNENNCKNENIVTKNLRGAEFDLVFDVVNSIQTALKEKYKEVLFLNIDGFEEVI